MLIPQALKETPGTPAGDGVEKRRPLKNLGIDELHALRDSLRNLLKYRKEGGLIWRRSQ